VVVLRRRERSFSKSCRFACTGAPVLRALGPPVSSRAELMCVLPAREATFFGRRVRVGFSLAPARFLRGSPWEGRCLNLVVFVVLRRRERTFWRKLSFRVHGSIGWWVAMPASQLGTRPPGRDRPHSLGRPRAVPAGTKFQIISFHVDESVPFGESRRFACTAAPILTCDWSSDVVLFRSPCRYNFTRVGKIVQYGTQNR